MSCFRILSLAGLTLAAGGTLVFVGAGAQQPPPSAPAPKSAQAPAPALGAGLPTPPEAKPDPAAALAFDAAVKNLEKNQHAWLETTLWQQMDVQGLMMQAQGVYRYGPDHHLRLDLRVACGDTRGRMEIACDGSDFWQRMQLGDDEPTAVSHIDWKKVQETLRRPDVAQYVRDDYLQSMSFAGLLPLLKGLKQRMTFTKQEKLRWHGHDVVRLTAAWNADVAKDVARAFLPPNQPGWPAFLPRQCRAYLDATTGWPYRLEWWGPSPPNPQDALLLEMEFRDPRPVPQDQVARAFRFSPGGAQVSDQTSQTVQDLTERARQMKQRRPR